MYEVVQGLFPKIVLAVQSASSGNSASHIFSAHSVMVYLVASA